MIERGFPPGVFILGAQKCGTSSLAWLLDQHPDISVADPKEPDFFTRFQGKGEEWYRRCFAGGPERLLVDASTSYTMAAVDNPLGPLDGHPAPLIGVPERIHAMQPKARFIYLVRDPVDRCYSGYLHRVRAGEEKLSFAEAMKRPSAYLCTSLYSRQIALYLRHFPLESFHFIHFDAFKRDPEGSARRCFRFLGLEEAVDLGLDKPKNQSFIYNGAGASLQNLVGGADNFKRLTSLAKKLMPEALQEKVKAMITKAPPKLESSERDRLREIFAAEVSDFRKLTGIDLTSR